MRLLIEKVPSALEGELTERRRRGIFGIKVKRRVHAYLRSNFLVLDPVSASASSSPAALQAGVDVDPRGGASSDSELSHKARLINLDGAVVEGSPDSHPHAFSVSYVCKQKNKVRHLVLQCATEPELDEWMRALARAVSHPAATRDDFESILLLGAGHFGRVTLVEHQRSGSLLALKEMREERVAAAQVAADRRSSKKRRSRAAKPALGELKLEKQISERLLLAQLADNRWVARLAFAFREHGKLYLAQEFAARGDLWSLIRARKRLGLDAARQLAAEVVSAVGSLHAVGVLHRDLKLENIMLDADGHVKLIDFGLSKLLTARPKTAGDGGRRRFGFTFSLCGTRYYMAPEQVCGVGHNLSADWWQVGCLVYELVVGKPAFYEKSHKLIDDRILSERGADMDIMGKLAGDGPAAAQAVAFVQALLTRESGDRLGSARDAEDVKAHAFFTGVDWALLDARVGPVADEIALYCDTGRPSHEVDTETVASYFRDAKTLEGRKLLSSLSKPGSRLLLLEEQRRRGNSSASVASVAAQQRLILQGGAREEKLRSSDSMTLAGSSSVDVSASTHAASSVRSMGGTRSGSSQRRVPTAPKRSEAGGPLLGFAFSASQDALADLGQGLVLEHGRF